jgi:hypothetical protein
LASAALPWLLASRKRLIYWLEVQKTHEKALLCFPMEKRQAGSPLTMQSGEHGKRESLSTPLALERR